MKVIYKIWSVVGSTPVTNRGGSYCDTLASGEFEADTPQQAEILLRDIASVTPHAYQAFFYMPSFWNQNTRQKYISVQS